MTEILATATAVAPIATAVVEAVKKSGVIPKSFLPIAALVVGILLGLAAAPVFGVSLLHSGWSGGIAGLSATGLFELGKKSKESADEKKHIKQLEEGH
ncbi:A118-like holin Hol118 [Salsuginibacillus halophilus]|uniref:A118-like holin Hol118 n=1 Tax=Salsuginibacillus halophilus TaxID=517424 RepID=A0A2P8H661_9BACI|nr:holin [Salsuginibacillus halophilus]PSL41693.1 A118-like holin Hol118 [Salsuginibacillus halophilus]